MIKRRYDCGCPVDPDHYCPMHDAAPDMYEVLKRWQEGSFSSQIEFANAARQALAKAVKK